MDTLTVVILSCLCLLVGTAFGVVMMCALALSGRISEQEEKAMWQKQHGDTDGDNYEKFI